MSSAKLAPVGEGGGSGQKGQCAAEHTADKAATWLDSSQSAGYCVETLLIHGASPPDRVERHPAPTSVPLSFLTLQRRSWMSATAMRPVSFSPALRISDP